LTTVLLAGFGTNRLRREEAMKTAGRENPNRWVTVPSTRVHGAEIQNGSRSIQWAGKQEKLQPMEKCFFLTSPFIELHRTWEMFRAPSGQFDSRQIISRTQRGDLAVPPVVISQLVRGFYAGCLPLTQATHRMSGVISEVFKACFKSGGVDLPSMTQAYIRFILWIVDKRCDRRHRST